MVVWIIGLSGAGKTTLGEWTARLAKKRRENVVFLDGDALREVFGNDLGYSLGDRKRNAERICRLCAALDAQGIHVICAILSLFQESRDWNRKHFADYFEVYIKASLESLIARDPKGLYKKALALENPNVAGLDIPFHEPDNPDLVIDNDGSLSDLVAYAETIANLIVNS